MIVEYKIEKHLKKQKMEIEDEKTRKKNYPNSKFSKKKLKIINKNYFSKKKQLSKKLRDSYFSLKIKGYKINPDLKEIILFSEKNLSEIENFQISNEFGKILFLGKIDIRDCELEKIFIIKKKEIEIYPKNIFFEGINKPPFGKKFNKKAILTYKNYLKYPKKGLCDKKRKKLKFFCMYNNIMFLGFNKDKNELNVLINHYNN